MRRAIGSGTVLLGAVLALSGCTDPYGPGQGALGGGAHGAGTGTAAGGGSGAAPGVLTGGAAAAAGGAAATRTAPAQPYNAPQPGYYPPPPPPPSPPYRSY